MNYKKDGSLPRVNKWQIRRRIARAPVNSHDPGENAPINTEAGLLMSGDIAAPGIDSLGGDHHDEVSWQWRHELVGETEDTELQKLVRSRTPSC